MTADGTSARRLTPKGAATRARIVDAANQLMYERGVAATTLADVRAASATSKSQVYQHFADKDALVKEVIETRAEDVLTQQRRRLRRVESYVGSSCGGMSSSNATRYATARTGARSGLWRTRSQTTTRMPAGRSLPTSMSGWRC